MGREAQKPSDNGMDAKAVFPSGQGWYPRIGGLWPSAMDALGSFAPMQLTSGAGALLFPQQRMASVRETTPHASPLKKGSFRAPPRTAELKLVDGRVHAQLELGGIARQYAERLGIGPARRRTS